MFNKLSASAKLYMLIIVLSTSIIGIGLYGIIEFKKMQNNTSTLYADRVSPLEQLTNIRYNYTVGILVTAQKVRTNEISVTEGIKVIDEAKRNIRVDWKKYIQTDLTPQERKLVDLSSRLIEQSTVSIEKFKQLLKKGDPLTTDAFLRQQFHAEVDEIIVYINQLIRLQVRVSSEIYANSRDDFNVALIKSLFIIACSLVFAIAFSYYLIQNIKELISDLKSSKEKYQSILLHAGDPIFLLNKEGFFIEVNDSMCQLLGYTEAELLSMHLSGLFTPEQLEVQPLQLKLLEKNRTLLLEKRWLKKNGTMVDVEINTRVFDGVGFFAIARDITQRIRAEEALRESERKYRNIFENVQDAFYQTDLEGFILEVSPSVVQHTGYLREELIGSDAADMYYNPEDRLRVIETLKRIGVLKDYEVYFKNKSGNKTLVSLNVRLINDFNGLPSHLDGSFQNITERKRIENELAEHKEQLAIFIEHSPASLAMFDTEMRYIATSNKWMQENNIFGQDIVGKSHYDVIPDLPQHFKDGHQRCLQGAIEKNEEDSFVHPDGRLDWIRWETRPWYKASGKIGGVIMLTEVITERKKATELFKLQFENSPDIILIVDKDLKIESINRGLPGGKTIDQIIGIDCVSILPEESREVTRQSILACLKTGLTQEAESELSNGIMVRSRFVPIVFHGEISRIMIIATDITESKIAEEKQKKSEEKHRVLIENITDTIILVNDKLEVIYQSPSFGRSAGFTSEELASKTVLDFVYSEDLQKSKDDLLRAKAAPGIPQHLQYRIVHKLGHNVWIEGTITNLLYNDSVNAYVVIYRDITERKVAEQELRLAYEHSKKQLEFITDLIWKQSHVLRGPLANLKGLSIIVQEDPDDTHTLGHFMMELERMDKVLREMAEDATKNIIS